MHFNRFENPTVFDSWERSLRLREREVTESCERLSGALSHLTTARKLQTPHRDLVYAEYAVQEQERLLAEYEYRLCCVQHRIGYSVLIYVDPDWRTVGK